VPDCDRRDRFKQTVQNSIPAKVAALDTRARTSKQLAGRWIADPGQARPT
jgi:hypothetical protein